MPQTVIPGRRWVTRGALRGQAVIEMALILPLLLFLVGGVVDFGLFMFQREQANACVREVARKAIVRSLTAAMTDPTSLTLLPQCKLAATKKAGPPALASALVVPAVTSSTPPFGTAVTASISFPYDPIFLDMVLPGFTSITSLQITSSITMSMEVGT
jgi:Flp pilus assembly protein TadG